MTVIMMDNQIYGMTGGQVAPTTLVDAKTQTSPYGNIEPPVDACAVAVSCGASYVARWTTAHPRELTRAIKEAIQHKGFSFLDVVDQCPTQAGRYTYGTADPVKLLRMIKANSIPIARAKELPAQELRGKWIVGKIHESQEKPEFTEMMYQLIQKEKKN